MTKKAFSACILAAMLVLVGCACHNKPVSGPAMEEFGGK